MKLYTILLVFVFLVPEALRAREKDWQIWLDQSLGIDLNENNRFRADQSFRIRQDMSERESYYFQLGLQHYRLSWVEYGGYIRYIHDDLYGQPFDELRPKFDLSLKWNWGGTRWANRSRFEYRFREEREDTLRYRNRQRIVFPGKLTPLDLKPYVAGEIFFDSSEDPIQGVNRFRTMLGVQTEPDGYIRKVSLIEGRRLTTNFYWMYQQTEKVTGLVNEYILGWKLGFFF